MCVVLVVTTARPMECQYMCNNDHSPQLFWDVVLSEVSARPTPRPHSLPCSSCDICKAVLLVASLLAVHVHFIVTGLHYGIQQ